MSLTCIWCHADDLEWPRHLHGIDRQLVNSQLNYFPNKYFKVCMKCERQVYKILNWYESGRFGEDSTLVEIINSMAGSPECH